MVIKAVIFDLFGVLVLPGYTSLFNRFPNLASEMNALIDSANDGVVSRRVFYESMADLVGVSVDEVRASYMGDYRRDESAVDWVRRLKSAGLYKLGLLSNVGHGWAEDFFSDQELTELFDEVVLSSDVGLSKPAPRVFDITAERLGVAPVECIMVDDRPSNIDGAKQAGMSGILYESLDKAKLDLASMLRK